ncbi:MAG TPA: hypothetical protein VD839_16920 [Burkholderiales bacterium]|nr:hypothetical protein [Burkholderiales bacterium]
MSNLELTLRVDAPPAGPDGSTDLLGAESQHVRERIYVALRLKPRSVSWVTLALGTPKAERAIESLVEERRAGRAVVGSAQLREELDEAENAESEWSILNTRQVDNSFSLWDDYPQCRAGTLPEVGALNHTFVSDRFVSAYEQARLNGLDFLRCRNSGRKPGPPWFVALPKHFLGKGLDHPWFDREPWVAHVAHDSRKRTTSIDTGQCAFHQFWLRRDQAERDPLLVKLLALCPLPAEFGTGLFGLRFQMAPRYFAGSQPDADFAYVPWGEDGPNRVGKVMRFRLLAVRRRARQALTEAGLFQDRDFAGVRSIALVEPGVELLDGRGDGPGPMYTEAELTALRASELEIGGPRALAARS